MTGSTIIAGLGFREQCSAEELVALVRQAEQAQGVVATMLAAPDFKAGHGALIGAADQLGLDVVTVPAQALAEAQIACLTRSATVLAAVGVASVAEACALSAAGQSARLLAPRLASPSATCALAQGDPS